MCKVQLNYGKVLLVGVDGGAWYFEGFLECLVEAPGTILVGWKFDGDAWYFMNNK
jgi:hypothetical protein